MPHACPRCDARASNGGARTRPLYSPPRAFGNHDSIHYYTTVMYSIQQRVQRIRGAQNKAKTSRTTHRYTLQLPASGRGRGSVLDLQCLQMRHPARALLPVFDEPILPKRLASLHITLWYRRWHFWWRCWLRVRHRSQRRLSSGQSRYWDRERQHHARRGVDVHTVGGGGFP